MSKTIKIGIGFALAWCLVKYVSFLMDPLPASIIPTVSINILFLLSSVAVALYFEKRHKQGETSALGDIKNGLKAAVPYTLVVSLFIYFFYATINPQYNQHQIDTAVTLLNKTMEDPVEFQKFKDSNASFETVKKEDIFAQIKTNIDVNYNPKTITTMALLSMLLLSTFYSMLVTVIYRKIIFKN